MTEISDDDKATRSWQTEDVSSPILSVFAVCLLVVSVETVSRLISLTGEGGRGGGVEERNSFDERQSASYLFLETSIPGCDTLLLSLRPVAR